MTWTAASDPTAFSFFPVLEAPKDLRSLIHQELRLIAFSEPLPQVIEQRPAGTARGSHRGLVVTPEPTRAGRWSAPWKVAKV